MPAEVTIIGSGMAAVAAAIEALSHGARVTMVRGRPGATALSSGAWDIAGDPLRIAGLGLGEIRPADENLHELIRRRPRHPYAVISQNPAVDDLSLFLEKAVERVASSLALRLKGSIRRPFVCLTPIGLPRPTTFVGRGLEAGNLLEMKAGGGPGGDETRPLIVGLKGIAQFSAPFAAGFLKRIFRQTAAVEIALERLPAVMGPIAVAQRLDEDRAIEELCGKVTDEVKRARPTHLIFPPVMGVDRCDHLLSMLHEATGVPCFETLALPPSVPGLRLQKAIDRFLGRGGIQLVDGEASKDRRLPAGRVILATGRYIGGGIIKEKNLRETVFGLSVVSEEQAVCPSFFGNHTLFSAGLRVTRNLQPVDETGRLVSENLWAAGAVLGGYDPATDQCGIGVAIGTGTLAGRMALA